jgi:outer membrane protein TolC
LAHFHPYGGKSSRAQLAKGLRLLSAASILLGACATYHPVALQEPSRVALAAPSVPELRVAAASLHHPYLAPLELDLEDGMTPDEAAVLAVLANPQLAALRAERGLAEAQVLAAGILPNPQLSLGVSLPRGGDPTAVTGSAVGVGLDLNSLISRGARRRSARLDLEQVDLDIAWQEWQIAQAARLQSLRRYYLEAQGRLAGQREATLGESLKVATEAAERRLVTEVERAAAETAFNEARALRLEAETEAQAARFELLRLMGFPPDAVFEIRLAQEPGDLPPLPATSRDETGGEETENGLVAGLEARRLDLAALRLGYESQEERVRAAVLSQFPAFNISLGRAKDTAGLVTAEPAISLELPIFDRHQGEIATERATREILRQEYAARLFEARAEVAQLTAAERQVRAQLEQAEAIVAARRQLVETFAQALRFGDADVLTFHDAQIDLLTSELDRLILRQSLAELRVGLATVLGVGGAQDHPERHERP